MVRCSCSRPGVVDRVCGPFKKGVSACFVRLHALTLNQVHAANRVMCATVCVSPQLAAASLVYGVPNRPRFFTRKTHPPAPRRPFWAPSGRLGTEVCGQCRV